MQHNHPILVDVVEMHDSGGHVSAGMIVTNLSFRSCGIIVYRSTPVTGNLRKVVAVWSTEKATHSQMS